MWTDFCRYLYNLQEKESYTMENKLSGNFVFRIFVM